MRFGVDFLFASVAVTQVWTTVALTTRRRNKLRSFSIGSVGEYRMGAKFAEVSGAIRNRVAQRLRLAPPATLERRPIPTPLDRTFVVPDYDQDITELAVSTARQLTADAKAEHLSTFPQPLQQRLLDHVSSGSAAQGLAWDLWRDCLFFWITAEPSETIPVELLETLFLNRVVGHHTEISGRTDWYSTVQNQADDVFAHRHRLWQNA